MHDALSHSLPHIVATTTISLIYLVIYFYYYGLYQIYGMQYETMECHVCKSEGGTSLCIGHSRGGLIGGWGGSHWMCSILIWTVLA